MSEHAYNFIDMTGQKIGRLTVISLTDKVVNGRRSYWLCKCDCGNETIVEGRILRKKDGGTKSCGCLMKERSHEANKKYNEYEELEDCYRGWDTKHENCFYISKEDYEVVKQYCWGLPSHGYWVANSLRKDGKCIKLHQLVMNNINKNYKELYDDIDIDHLDRDKNNNTRCNLEIKTHLDNMKNKTTYKNNNSGKSGVYFHNQSNRWRATIKNTDGKRITKNFKNKEDAIAWRKEKEKEYGYTGE